MAIRRELREEVGLIDVDLGPLIWRRTHEFPVSAEFGGQREVFYLVRPSESVQRPSLSEEELLSEGLTGSRWWTLGEIRETRDERFAPRRLATFLESLIRHGPPATVIDTGV